MAEIAFPTGYERGLTPLALNSLRQRRRRLLGEATGTVLDLGGCDAHPDLYGDVERVVMLTTPEEGGERLRRRAEGAAAPVEVVDSTVGTLAASGDATFDTIVSILQLSVLEDPGPTLRAITELLGDQGRLVFIEPTSTEGLTLRAQRLFATPARFVTSRRLGRDLPAQIRGSGLVITDLDRFNLRLMWPYRSFVQGVARRPTAKTT